MTASLVLASAAFAVWLYLIVGRGDFWRASVRDDAEQHPNPLRWPRIAAVIPARNEAEMIVPALGSLLKQDYPGVFSVVVVDDQSTDGTARAATAAAAHAGAPERLAVVKGAALPPGWADFLARADGCVFNAVTFYGAVGRSDPRGRVDLPGILAVNARAALAGCLVLGAEEDVWIAWAPGDPGWRLVDRLDRLVLEAYPTFDDYAADSLARRL